MNEKRDSVLSNHELYCVVTYIVRRLWMVLLAAGMALMLVYVGESVLTQPSYTSNVTFSVTSKMAFGTSYNNVAAATTIAEQFSQLLDSEVVRNGVCKELGYDDQKFPAKISVSVPEDTNIIDLKVTANSPELAFRTALAITNSYEEYSSFIFETAVMGVIYGPSVPTQPDNAQVRSRLLTWSLPLGAALMLLILLLFALQSETVQTVSGAHRQLDAKILSTVYHQKKMHTAKSLLSNAKQSLLISNPTASFYYTETIHQIRVQLEHAQRKRGDKTFLITSCSENEGKSTIAANIALSLAQKHERVLLVDADLRKPAQNKIFEAQVHGNRELGALLAKPFSKDELLDALQYDRDTNLFTLYTASGRNRSTELLSSETAQAIMRSLRASFDYVIVDSSPIGYFIDSEVLSDLCDATILVVKQDVTPAPLINDVIDTLNASNTTFLGCILNNVHTFNALGRMSGSGYGYGYGYRYGYGQEQTQNRSKSKREETPHAGA